jgi:hypothetical protein
MKKVDIAMLPVPQEVIPLIKKNIKRMNNNINIGGYIEHVVAMHSQVLDQIDKEK